MKCSGHHFLPGINVIIIAIATNGILGVVTSEHNVQHHKDSINRLCRPTNIEFEFEFCFSSHLCQLWLIRD